MTLTINGEEREFTGGAPLFGLSGLLGMKPDRVAVELNRELISRDRWAATQLSTGDKLEIVHFVGGGSNCSVGGPNSGSFSVLAM
jgi:thiamine biosynthesis protein ThiS